MANLRSAGFRAAIFLISCAILFNGCAGVQTGQVLAAEQMLTDAGFQPLGVNMETPKRQALLNSIPPGKIVTYLRNGEVYHVYADELSRTLYMGDELAYRRYLSMVQERQVSPRERINAGQPEHQEFWQVLKDSQGAGPR